MSFKYFLLVMVSYLVVIFFLRCLNFRRQMRHRQIWYLIVAIIFYLSLISILHMYPQLISRYDNSATEWIGKIFHQNTPSTYHARKYHFLVSLNLFILILFYYVKAFVALIIRLSDFIRFIIYKIKRGKVSQHFYPPGQVPSVISFAYEYDLSRGILLREKWLYPGIFARHMAFMFLGLLAIAIFGETVHPIPVAFPEILIFALILSFEVAWYLDGDRPLKRSGVITGVGPKSEREADYTQLWEEYQKIWAEKCLLAWNTEYDRKNSQGFSGSYFKGSGGTELEAELSIVWQGLVNEGYHLTEKHAQILEALWKGKDALISNTTVEEISPALFALMRKTLIDGDKILIITDQSTAFSKDKRTEIIKWLKKGIFIHDTPPQWGISDLRTYMESNIMPDILLISAPDLNSPEIYEKPWFKQLKLILIPDASATIAKDILLLKAFIIVLKALSENEIQLVVMDTCCDNLEQAMRKNIPISPDEYTMSLEPASKLFAIVWHLEDSRKFQEEIMKGNISEYLGTETILALLALKEQVDTATLLDSGTATFREHIEEVTKHLDCLDESPIPGQELPKDIRNRLHRVNAPWLARSSDNNVIFVRDDCYNLVSALKRCLPLGKKAAFVHVTSSSYLLKDYFADNIEYFIKTPVFKFAPSISKTPVSIAYPLLQRLVAFKLPEDEILNEIQNVYPDEKFAEIGLRKLFREVFDIDIVKENYIEIEQRHELEQSALVEKTYLGLSRRIRRDSKLKWLTFFKITDNSGNTLALIKYDHLYQTYLPGQIHPFDGKPYEIKSINERTKSVSVSFSNPECEYLYRPKLSVHLNKLREIRFPDVHCVEETRGDWRVRLELCEADFDIETSGFYTFTGGIDVSLKKGLFTRLASEIKREYRPGRTVIFSAATRNATNLNRDRIPLTLTLLMNEIWCSFFPESYRFIVACCPGKLTEIKHEASPIPPVIPSFNLSENLNPAEKFEGFTNVFTIYLFEDSHLDMGLLQTFFENWEQFLELLDDYLAWLTEEPQSKSGNVRKHIDDKYRYLKYGLDALPGFLDLKGTKRVLEGILMQSERRLTSKRSSFSPTVKKAREAPEKGTMRQCDFCGRYIKETELERLDDGRERCSDCRKTAINSLSQLKEVFNEAKDFMESNYGVKIVPHVNVRFASASEIQKERGIIFTPTPEFDPRAIGLAVSRGNNEYEILVENGQPYHMTMEVTVHELTHIWQYVNLDVNRMYAEYDKLLIEGHAMWAGLTCLETKGIAPSYVERQKQRDDAYGKGYWMIRELIAKHSGERSPFRILKKLYPKA